MILAIMISHETIVEKGAVPYDHAAIPETIPGNEVIPLLEKHFKQHGIDIAVTHLTQHVLPNQPVEFDTPAVVTKGQIQAMLALGVGKSAIDFGGLSKPYHIDREFFGPAKYDVDASLIVTVESTVPTESRDRDNWDAPAQFGETKSWAVWGISDEGSAYYLGDQH